MNSQEYYLNIRPDNGYPQTVKVSQGDVGRPLLFHLMDGASPLSIPAGATVIIHGTKPSGLGFTESCTVSGSSAAVSTTIEITQEYGLFPAELVVSANDDVLATANFMLYVERSPHQEGTTDGVAEDLQDIYEQLDDLKDDIENISGISDDVKTALLQIAQKVAYVDDDGADYYQDLYDALYPPAPPKSLESISAVYTQSGTIYTSDTLDDLKPNLVVTATYDDSTTAEVTSYTLSGTLTEGTSTITVTYEDKTDTFDVIVSRELSPSEQWTSGVAYTPTVIQNQYVEKASGRIKGYNGWDWTGYMPCKGAATIVVPPIVEDGSTTGQAPASNAFFAEDYSVVQNAVMVSRTQYTTLTVPANASWIGLSSDRASLADCIALGIKPYA